MRSLYDFDTKMLYRNKCLLVGGRTDPTLIKIHFNLTIKSSFFIVFLPLEVISPWIQSAITPEHWATLWLIKSYLNRLIFDFCLMFSNFFRKNICHFFFLTIFFLLLDGVEEVLHSLGINPEKSWMVELWNEIKMNCIFRWDFGPKALCFHILGGIKNI